MPGPPEDPGDGVSDEVGTRLGRGQEAEGRAAQLAGGEGRHSCALGCLGAADPEPGEHEGGGEDKRRMTAEGEPDVTPVSDTAPIVMTRTGSLRSPVRPAGTLMTAAANPGRTSRRLALPGG